MDDDPSVRRALGRLIRSLKMGADTYSSAEEFLQHFGDSTEKHPDCLILDLRLPGMSGLELQARLAGSPIPIIFISAHDEADAHKYALSAGAVAFLRKPFEEQLLIRSIDAALARVEIGSAPSPRDNV